MRMHRLLIACTTALFFVGISVGAGTSSDLHAIRAAGDISLKTQGTARISYHSRTGKLRFVGTDGEHAITVPEPQNTSTSNASKSAEEKAKSFLLEYAQAFGIEDSQDALRVMRTRTSSTGKNVVRLQQMHRGVPVLGGEFYVHQNGKGAVTCAIGKAAPDLDVDVQPSITAQQATEIALELTSKIYSAPRGSLSATDPQLFVYAPVLLGVSAPPMNLLVWQLEVQGVDDPTIREYVLIHATTGKVVLHYSNIHHAKYRKVYSSNHTSTLPGILYRSEGQAPSLITDVNSAYDATGSTYDFYWSRFGRDSIDNSGMQLISSVRYCPSSSECPYLNAFWNGSQMVFGDNMTADDVCAHEMTHGVTERESHLFYYMQPGTINESMSDIFGEFVDLVNGLGNDSSNVRWKIGEDLPASIGVVRDMANPPAYNQPDTTTSPLYYCGSDDNGGVHQNDGIPNKCAYLMTDGGSFNGYTVQALGLEKTARIWYEVNCNYLTSAADFQDLYDALIQASIDLTGTTVYGGGIITRADCQQVKNAADAVGLGTQPQGCPTPEAAFCTSDNRMPIYIFADDLENPSRGIWVRGYAVGGFNWYYPQNTHSYPGWDATYATSGQYNFWGDDVDSKSDSWIAMNQDVYLPPTASAIYMHFRHAYDFDGPNYDGGVVEYSVDGGVTWTDAGSLIEENGYNATLSTSFQNPLGGRQAFSGSSNGYISTRLNLTPLKGSNVRFRFRLGTDTSGASLGWFIDDIMIYTCGYRVETEEQNTFNTAAGWFEFVRVPSSGGLAETDFDSQNAALRIRVSSDPSRYRIAGWMSSQNDWLPFLYVGTNNYVRGKFYVYATGQANPQQLNTIPNFRLRLSNRFAVSSILEVLPHSNATSGDEPVSLEIRPSTDPSKPSLYRVDFAPIPVPQLLQNPLTEGIARGFEIYALDPQDNGYVCLTESVIGVYPKAAISPSGSNEMWLATYAPTASSAGDLDPYKAGATLDRFSMIMSGDGEFPTRDSSTYPNVSAGPGGLIVDTSGFDNAGGSRVGVVQVDFSPDVSVGQHVRIEPNKQYLVRYHVTSTQQSNRNPQMRLRARTIRFAWTQKYEVGGAWAIESLEHSTLAAQALPGIGSKNPDKIGGEAGGWYNLILHSPLNIDIRPDMSGTLCERMPNLCAQPGPGAGGTSLRDLKVAFDVVDTMSPSSLAYLEAGNFRVDRIEVFSFDQIPD